MFTKKLWGMSWKLWQRYCKWMHRVNEKHRHRWLKRSCFPGHQVKICECGKIKGSKGSIIIYRLWMKLDENSSQFTQLRNQIRYEQRPVYKEPPNYCKPL